MEKIEIGKFNAVSFDENVDLEFIVYNDGTFDCPALEQYGYNHIALSPKFILLEYKKDKSDYPVTIRKYVYDVVAKGQNSLKLIGRYDIDDNLFCYLDEHKMVSYSDEEANLYGFTRNEQKNNKSSRRSKKRGQVFVKQRQVR